MNNLFLFTGEETFLLHQLVLGWKDAFIKKQDGDMNLAVLDGGKMDLKDIISQIGTLPFLGDKRLIFIENLPEAAKAAKAGKESDDGEDETEEKSWDKFIACLEKTPESSVVVFVQPKPDKRRTLYKKIVQLAAVKEFKPLAGPALVKWVQDQIKKKGSSLTGDTAQRLIDLSGSDLWRLDQELNKLAAFADGAKIDAAAIDAVVIPSLETNIFHLTDALGEKDRQKAIHNLHRTLAAGESLRQVFHMIVRQFRILLEIAGYLSNYPSASPASIALALKQHPFVIRNTMSQLRRFKISELKDAYARLLGIDVGLKTSRIRVTADDQEELALEIEKFMVEFCR